jgi:hypothetical protein
MGDPSRDLRLPQRATSFNPGLRGTSYPGKPSPRIINPNGVAAIGACRDDATPLGLGKMLGRDTQCSLADSATLGIGAQSRWDWSAGFSPLQRERANEFG